MLLEDRPLRSDRGAGTDIDPSARSRKRPRLLVELVLVPLGYAAYAAVRNTRGQPTAAQTHRAFVNAQSVIGLERELGLWHEHTIQKVLLHAPLLIKSLDVFYATAHFIVTLGVLVFLYTLAPREYSKLRTALGVTTVLALIGFAVFPCLPPRLLPPDRGFVDTLHMVGGVWSFKTPVIERISDPFAAMPSLHLGWATWCAVAVHRSVERRWIRWLAWAYPVASALTVLGTANHYILDIMAGVAIAVLGLAAAEIPARMRASLAARRTERTGQVALVT